MSPIDDHDIVPNTHYAIQVAYNGRLGKANAYTFQGHNLGRFANQGGLYDCLKTLACDLSRHCSARAKCDWVALSLCQLHFSAGTGPDHGNHVSIMTVGVDRLDCTCYNTKELFVNYRICNYWIQSDVKNVIVHDKPTILVHLARWIVAENYWRKFIMQPGHVYTDQQLTDILPPLWLNLRQTQQR